MKYKVVLSILITTGVFFVSCKKTDGINTNDNSSFKTTSISVTSIFPTQFGLPALPSDNPLTEEGVYLGRLLFYDKNLSIDKSIACASCHEQGKAFAEDKKVSIGINGLKNGRNASALFNMAYSRTFFWDGRQNNLKTLVFEPIQSHIEMGMNMLELNNRLKESSLYQMWFKKAFNNSPNINEMSLALEQFLLTIVSKDSKFDKAGPDLINFTASEKRGAILFNSLADFSTGINTGGADCFHCHGSVLFQSQNPIMGGVTNNGLDSDFTDKGLGAITGKTSDLGLFKTPSLRNIELTAPYMHDGRFATLADVIEHYSEHIKFNSPNLSPNLANHIDGPGGNPKQMKLTTQQKTDLINYLKTLTDNELIVNPLYSSPY